MIMPPSVDYKMFKNVKISVPPIQIAELNRNVGKNVTCLWWGYTPRQKVGAKLINKIKTSGKRKRNDV